MIDKYPNRMERRRQRKGIPRLYKKLDKLEKDYKFKRIGKKLYLFKRKAINDAINKESKK
jgi:hypothetical protein